MIKESTLIHKSRKISKNYYFIIQQQFQLVIIFKYNNFFYRNYIAFHIMVHNCSFDI